MNKFIKQLTPFIFLLPGLLLYGLVLWVPLPSVIQQLGLDLRYGFPTPLIILAIVLYIVYRLPGWLGEISSALLTLSVFALCLLAIWVSGQSENYIFAGLLPWSDASGYYIGALKFLAGFPFLLFPARRPLFPSLFSGLLAISGSNLQMALALLTAFAGLSVHALTRLLRQYYGTAVAVLTWLVMFLYVRRFTGATMSEIYGFIFGALAATLLLSGIHQTKRSNILVGLFFLALGQLARPGTMLLLPVLVLWAGWFFRGARRFSISFSALASVAVAGAFLLNSVCFQMVAPPGAKTFSNASLLIYGLATGGKTWHQAYRDYPELMDIPEEERFPKVMDLAIEHIRQKPIDLVQGVLVQYQVFFTDSSYGGYSYVDKSLGESQIAADLAQLALWALGLISMAACYKFFPPAQSLFILASTAGILISIPLAAPTDALRLRFFAASIPLQAFIPAMGLNILIQKTANLFNQSPSLLTKPLQSIKALERYFPASQPEWPTCFAAAIGIILTLSTIASPWLIRLTDTRPASQAAVCPPEQVAMQVFYPTGASTNITEASSNADEILQYSETTFKRNSHNLPAEFMIQEMNQLKPPTSILPVVDRKSGEWAWIIADSRKLPAAPAELSVCGQWSPNPNVSTWNLFYAKSIKTLSNP
jgi:hypothetical protein